MQVGVETEDAPVSRLCLAFLASTAPARNARTKSQPILQTNMASSQVSLKNVITSDMTDDSGSESDADYVVSTTETE